MTDTDRLQETLRWLERETALRTRVPRMLSSGEQGLFLQALSLMLKPSAILEIGTFTGYSTLCFSRGLPPDGRIDTLEVYDELQDLIEEGFRKAGMQDRIHLHIGDAKQIIPTLDHKYDLVFIDANKREYLEYYHLVFDKVRKGGYIMADNVLWSGKVLMENPPQDAQTQSIIAFNRYVAEDPRVESFLLPLRDGLYICRKL